MELPLRDRCQTHKEVSQLDGKHDLDQTLGFGEVLNQRVPQISASVCKVANPPHAYGLRLSKGVSELPVASLPPVLDGPLTSSLGHLEAIFDGGSGSIDRPIGLGTKSSSEGSGRRQSAYDRLKPSLWSMFKSTHPGESGIRTVFSSNPVISLTFLNTLLLAFVATS